MKQTVIELFKNTPLIDFQNTIHFKSNSERDTFFNDKYDTIRFNNPFNWIRDKSTIKTSLEYERLQGVNYCRFKSDFDGGKWFYAYVIGYRYMGNTTEIDILVDGIMTYTQGKVLNQLPNLSIERQHLTNANYNANLWELRNNSDVLNVNTKSYFYSDGVYFTKFIVLMQSSNDLTAEFGDEDNPITKTSTGATVDKVSSPLSLYAVKQEHFKNFMQALSDYPWIAQNIKNVILIPDMFFDDTALETVTTTFGFSNLMVVKDNTISNTSELDNELKKIDITTNQLYSLFDLDPINDKHLLRNNYQTFELYAYDGQALSIDLGQLNTTTGFQLAAEKIIGFENEIAIYPKDYKKGDTPFKTTKPSGGVSSSETDRGSFLNDAIIFKNFDSVPVLIDNYKLALAKNANQRELANSKTLTGQVSTLTDSSADLKDRFFAGASMISNLNPTNLLGKFTSDYEYYRQQKAQFADMQLEAPTITEQTNSNSFQVANNIFGITLKCSKINSNEMDKIRKYYNAFGFEWNRENTTLNDVESMSVCNYVKFKGSWTIQNADVALVEMMKAQFENGVRLWHNNGSTNPMFQNLNQNVRVI